MSKRFSISSGVALAALTLTFALLPAGATSAVQVGAGGLVPVKFGLPAAKEGQPYSFSIAGAATGGVKPYHCTPAEPFGPLWAWLHVASNCLISGKAPVLPAGTSERITVLRFKLSDSESPAKTVTLYPMAFAIHSKAEDYPFDGTWKVKQTATGTVTCPGAPAITKSVTTTVELKVVHGVFYGHKLSVSVTGSSATVTTTVTAAGVTVTERYEFTVTGAVTGVRSTGSGSGSTAGCSVEEHETGSGTRVSK